MLTQSQGSHADQWHGCAPQVNKATMGLLKFVEPYVAFGYPSRKSVKELIYKRGHAKVRSGFK